MVMNPPDVATVGPFATYEVIVFVVLLIGVIPMTVRFLQCRNRWFYAGYLAFFIGFIASMVSATAQALEHFVGIALAGFLLWWTGMTGATKLRNPEFYDEFGEEAG